jgi:signal transduction histidine kinase
MARIRTERSASPATSWTRGYAFALLLTLAGGATTMGSAQLMAAPFFMFQFAAVVGAALYGGFGPGLLTTALSALAFTMLYFRPSLEPHEAWRVGSFLAVSVFFAGIAAKVRRARNDAEEARARAEAAELEARAIGAQQERLVAVVSHDLRSPLNAIRLNTDALRTAGASPELKARALGRITASVDRMQSMIGDLLDYARARHASGLPVHTRPGRLGEISRRVIEEASAGRPGAIVELQVDGDDCAPLDPARVEQVVSNLVSNALKYAHPGAPVKVGITGEPALVRLEVSNRGPPIPEHLLSTLFDPFRPGDAPGSVGLGLFIVREIARGHGGTASARSDEQETTFTVTFPRSAPAPSSGRARPHGGARTG